MIDDCCLGCDGICDACLAERDYVYQSLEIVDQRLENQKVAEAIQILESRGYTVIKPK